MANGRQSCSRRRAALWPLVGPVDRRGSLKSGEGAGDR